ncbi:hypothetical protein WJX81_000002 [Elliptochloris bilobata]|uniref:Uncharacterized protein n=1 Tax=Elliptochloris bilobata TaxID=381761 RepID=A0AAW1QLR2_9CHLO
MAEPDATAPLSGLVRFGSVWDGIRRLTWHLKGSHSATANQYCLSLGLFDVAGKFWKANFLLNALVLSEFAAKEPDEWLAELGAFHPGAVELKNLPGLCLSIPLSDSPDRRRFRRAAGSPPAVFGVPAAATGSVGGGALSELMDEFGVQYGRAQEAARERQDKEQAQAEVVVLKQQLAVTKEQLKRQRSNGSGSLQNLESGELRRMRAAAQAVSAVWERCTPVQAGRVWGADASGDCSVQVTGSGA